MPRVDLGRFGMEQEKKKCPCTYDCERHGDCKACKAYHHALKQKTCCERKAQ